jgi:hypothetical protein
MNAMLKCSNRWLTIPVILLLLGSTASTPAADLVHAKDGSGVYGYKDTPKLPWCDYLVHDPDRPAPLKVDPGNAPPPTPVPEDALVLFDGQDLSQWEQHSWRLVDGTLEAAGGSSPRTRKQFGNFQLHLEWMPPANFKGPWYDQGNNGVMLHGRYEIQIFDSWNEKLYPDGQAAAIYAQTPPLVNACRPPGQWQSYDILFTAPVFKGDQLAEPARITMLHNGILVHLNQEIHGSTGHRILPSYDHKSSQGPLALAGHGCPVRFRNIWIREL